MHHGGSDFRANNGPGVKLFIDGLVPECLSLPGPTVVQDLGRPFGASKMHESSSGFGSCPLKGGAFVVVDSLFIAAPMFLVLNCRT